jgi:glycosyltransferase involved in cell wall biosynthesis
VFSSKNKFIFTAPSQWMVDKAKKSSVLSGHEILLAPNVLGPTFLDDVSVKPIAEIEGRKIRVGVASGDPNSFTKGGDLVQTIANYPFLEVVLLKDYTESRHGEFWNYIDTLFVPSRADNSPNVILEANAFGVPIVAAKVGGIPENLSPEFDYLFEIGVDDMDYVVDLIKESATRKYLKMMVTPSLQKDRDIRVINEYMKIYENLA